MHETRPVYHLKLTKRIVNVSETFRFFCFEYLKSVTFSKVGHFLQTCWSVFLAYLEISSNLTGNLTKNVLRSTLEKFLGKTYRNCPWKRFVERLVFEGFKTWNPLKFLNFYIYFCKKFLKSFSKAYIKRSLKSASKKKKYMSSDQVYKLSCYSLESASNKSVAAVCDIYCGPDDCVFVQRYENNFR